MHYFEIVVISLSSVVVIAPMETQLYFAICCTVEYVFQSDYLKEELTHHSSMICVKVLTAAGHKVIYSHKDDGQNFYDFDDGLFAKPLPEFDLIISNPPFHNKAKLVEKIINIGKPFALLLPMTWLNDSAPYRLFARGG